MTAPALVGRLYVEDTDPCTRCGTQLGVHPDRRPAHVGGQLVGSDLCAWLLYAALHRLCPDDRQPLGSCPHSRGIAEQLATVPVIHTGGTP